MIMSTLKNILDNRCYFRMIKYKSVAKAREIMSGALETVLHIYIVFYFN